MKTLHIENATIEEDLPNRFWVVHPSNGAILATTTTRREAEEVCRDFGSLGVEYGGVK